MISLEVGGVPLLMVGNEQNWGNEYETTIHSGDNPPHRYRHDQIRDALRLETHGKCAYCESYIEHVSYSHIEHIFPKAVFPLLVCTWSNLTLACQICNTNKGDYYSQAAALLNPYVDDVENQIQFLGPMALEFSDRAKLTISKLKLNRPELLFKRTEKLTAVKRLHDLLDRAGNNQALIEALESELHESLSRNSEYTSCSRYFNSTTNGEAFHGAAGASA